LELRRISKVELKGKTILITGAAGFIGSNQPEKLLDFVTILQETDSCGCVAGGL
jgi:FlaA1/EpsC-like NDP-sugar epimerase